QQWDRACDVRAEPGQGHAIDRAGFDEHVHLAVPFEAGFKAFHDRLEIGAADFVADGQRDHVVCGLDELVHRRLPASGGYRATAGPAPSSMRRRLRVVKPGGCTSDRRSPGMRQAWNTGSSSRKVPASASISTLPPTGTMNCWRMCPIIAPR